MSILQYDDYLNQLKSSEEDFKAEALRVQRRFLYSIYSHHRLWAAHTENPDIANFHARAADLAQESIEQYDKILERYYLSTTSA